MRAMGVADMASRRNCSRLFRALEGTKPARIILISDSYLQTLNLVTLNFQLFYAPTFTKNDFTVEVFIVHKNKVLLRMCEEMPCRRTY